MERILPRRARRANYAAGNRRRPEGSAIFSRSPTPLSEDFLHTGPDPAGTMQPMENLTHARSASHGARQPGLASFLSQGALDSEDAPESDAHDDAQSRDTLRGRGLALHGVVLASDARLRFSAEGLRDLASAEAGHRARLGLTGHAYFHDGRLIEYIEGPLDAIESLTACYERDPRFTLRQVVRAQAISERRFGNWTFDACDDDELMDLRLEHVLEALLQNFASSLFGQERTQSAIWRLVDAIARRQAKAAQSRAAQSKAEARRATRLVMAH